MYGITLFLGDVAGSEILVILAVILLFFGSKSIPGIAKTMGQALYQIRNASNELQQEIKKSGVGIKEELNINSILTETQEQLVQPLDQMYSDVENSMHYTGRPQTPIEKATEQDALPITEELPLSETAEITESQATTVEEEKSTEPNKPEE
jgi:sec-independent protein translocase protein TatA